jgi:hypothetical protein
MGKQYKPFKKSACYLSLGVRSEIGQCTEGSGNVTCSALPDRQLSEAGFVLANSITYFNMSGSGNRDGPEPYFTYLRSKDTGTHCPSLLCIAITADKDLPCRAANT